MLRRLWSRVRHRSTRPMPSRPAAASPSASVRPRTVRSTARPERAGPADYHPDHRSLAPPVGRCDGSEQPPVPSLGLVAVPTSRPWRQPGGGLQPGVQLALAVARERDCPVLVLCSGDAEVAAAPPELREDPRVHLVDLRERRLLLPPLRTSRHPVARVWGRDTSRKRNVAVAVAFALRLRFLLFLDDDISPCPAGADAGSRPTLDGEGLDCALRALDGGSSSAAAGWRTAPDGERTTGDHSVVGHARLLARWEQTAFFGAGALLVRLGDSVPPFFPEVYSEDWLFLFALAYDHGDPRAVLADAGFVRQAEYDPFKIARARREEFGDTLAEGLFGLLHHTGAKDLFERAARVSFWKDVVNSRRAMVLRLRRALGPGMAAAALEAGLEQSRRHSSEDYLHYLQDWRQDLITWGCWLVRLRLRARPGWTLQQALSLVATVDSSLVPRSRAAHPVKDVINV